MGRGAYAQTLSPACTGGGWPGNGFETTSPRSGQAQGQAEREATIGTPIRALRAVNVNYAERRRRYRRRADPEPPFWGRG